MRTRVSNFAIAMGLAIGVTAKVEAQQKPEWPGFFDRVSYGKKGQPRLSDSYAMGEITGLLLTAASACNGRLVSDNLPMDWNDPSKRDAFSNGRRNGIDQMTKAVAANKVRACAWAGAKFGPSGTDQPGLWEQF